MQPPRPDLTIKEVVTPQGRWCRSGHVAPENFRRDPDKDPEPTKFFQVSSKTTGNGVYCEPCLVVAHAMAREKKAKT